MSPLQIEVEWLGSLVHTVTPKTVTCAHERREEEIDSGKDGKRE